MSNGRAITEVSIAEMIIPAEITSRSPTGTFTHDALRGGRRPRPATLRQCAYKRYRLSEFSPCETGRSPG